MEGKRAREGQPKVSEFQPVSLSQFDSSRISNPLRDPTGSEFSPVLIKFSSNGDLLLADKEMYSVAYPMADGDGDLTQITERRYDDM